MTQAQHLLAMYFGQDQNYISDSRGESLPINTMAPAHAANAATRLMADAATFAVDCGAETCFPAVWMAQQPLWLALVHRARYAR